MAFLSLFLWCLYTWDQSFETLSYFSQSFIQLFIYQHFHAQSCNPGFRYKFLAPEAYILMGVGGT